MDAIVTAFVAAALAEWGDRTQWLAAALAAGAVRPVRILAPLLAAILLGSLIAAFAGILVAEMISPRAMSLMMGLAMLFAGVAGLVIRRRPTVEESGLPFFVAAFILFLAAETGDRSQFLTFAIAGRFDSPLLAAAGAVGGSMTAMIPALLLGERLGSTLPVTLIRRIGTLLFLIGGVSVAVSALGLV